MSPPRILVYRCPRCGSASPNVADVADRYCGHCHANTGGQVLVSTWDDPWDRGSHPLMLQPRLGCSTVSHERLGWCSACPAVDARAELLAWRLDALDCPVPGYTGAVRFCKDRPR